MQDQQHLQGFSDILIFHSLRVVLAKSISEHSRSLCLNESKNPKQSAALLNPAAKKLFCKKIFVKTIKLFV